MEEPDNSNTWFILHDGERFGPYSMQQLREGVEFREINPRLDMAWKEGMDDWIPAGEIEGLFVKKTDAQAAEQKDSKKKNEGKEAKSAFSETEYQEESSEFVEDQEWEGVSRGGFFFFCYIFPVLWLVGLSYGSKLLSGVLSEDLIPIVIGCLALLPFLTAIFAILQRFQNLAMSRLWFLGLIAPLLNFWLGYRLFACPPGYAEHKKLGALGWILAIIYWLPLLAALAVGAIVMIKGPGMFEDVIEKNRPQYERLMLKVKEITQSPEEAKAKEVEEKAKEKAEKGPSIIPITR